MKQYFSFTFCKHNWFVPFCYALTSQFDVTFPALPCSILSLDAMDISGEQHLDVVCITLNFDFLWTLVLNLKLFFVCFSLFFFLQLFFPLSAIIDISIYPHAETWHFQEKIRYSRQCYRIKAGWDWCPEGLEFLNFISRDPPLPLKSHLLSYSVLERIT